MEDYRREESIVVNAVYGLYGRLQRVGINNVIDRLDCTLFILYSLHKEIPFPDTIQDSRREALKESTDVLYNRLFDSVEQYLRNARHFYVLQEEYMDLRHSIRENFEQQYPQALSFLFQFAYEHAGRSAADFYQPTGLSYLIAQILNSYAIRTVYNPFAGTARIMKSLRDDIHYLGQEINGRQILYAHVLKDAFHADNAHIIQGDSIRDWQGQHYDAIYATMPWGLRVNEFGESQGTSEAFFLRRASEDAILSVGIYPYAILFRGGKEKALRVDIVKRDLVETIIKLPTHLFAPMTNVQTCIIITNKRKARKGCVRFIDASSYVMPNRAYSRLDVKSLLQVYMTPEAENPNTLWVQNDDILDNDANLAMEHYQSVELPDVPEGSRLIPLEDILVRITKRDSIYKSTVPLIRVSDLAVNPFDFSLDASFAKEAAFNSAFVHVNQPALFISRLRPLKPTYFVEKKGDVYINPNVYAYQVDTKKVSPQYLLNELTKDYVQKQLFYAGATIPVLTNRTFLDIKILLPSKEEQDLFVVKGVQDVQNVRDNALSTALDTYLIEWGQRQHTLGHAVGAIDDILDTLSYAREQHNGVLHDEDVVDTKGTTVNEYFHKLFCAKNRLAELVDHLSDGIAWEDPEEILLIDFLKRYRKDNVQRNYSLDIVHAKEDKFIIKFARKRLYDVIENIIHNCKKHGFVDDQDDYNVRIVVQEDTLNKKPAVSIVIMNNGRELDSSMDAEKVFQWGESTKGSGLGGSRIKLSVMTYGGTVKFLLKDNLPEGYNAGYKIVLPLYNNI